MDVQLLEELEKREFSPARRIFVLQEILHRAKAFGHPSVASRIERILQLDRHNVRNQYRRHHLNVAANEDPHLDELARGRQEAHLAFLAIVLHIQATCLPTTARQLLEPAQQQWRRLQDFSTRSGDHKESLRDFGDIFQRPAT